MLPSVQTTMTVARACGAVEFAEFRAPFPGQVWPHSRVRSYLGLDKEEPVIDTIVKPKTGLTPERPPARDALPVRATYHHRCHPHARLCAVGGRRRRQRADVHSVLRRRPRIDGGAGSLGPATIGANVRALDAYLSQGITERARLLEYSSGRGGAEGALAWALSEEPR